MTKKDLEFVANVLHSVKPMPGAARERQWILTVNAFSEALAQENPRFSLGKFERAVETGIAKRPEQV